VDECKPLIRGVVPALSSPAAWLPEGEAGFAGAGDSRQVGATRTDIEAGPYTRPLFGSI